MTNRFCFNPVAHPCLALYCRQLQSASVSDIALMLKSMAALQFSPVGENFKGNSATSNASAAVAAEGGSDGSGAGLFPRAVQHLTAGQVDAMADIDLADVLWACAWVGHHDEALLAAAAKKLLTSVAHQAAALDQGQPLGPAAAHSTPAPPAHLLGGLASLLGFGSQPPKHPGATTQSPAVADPGVKADARSGEDSGSQTMLQPSPGWPRLPTGCSRNCGEAGGLMDWTAASHNPALPPDVPSLAAPTQPAGGGGNVPPESILHPENLTKVKCAKHCSICWASACRCLPHYGGDRPVKTFIRNAVLPSLPSRSNPAFLPAASVRCCGPTSAWVIGSQTCCPG